MADLGANRVPHTSPDVKSKSPLTRLVAIGAVLLVILGLFVYAGGWFTPHKLTAAVIVDTFEKLNGKHPGFRRNHAKGVDITGYYESNGQGQSLSKAEVFRPGRVPIVGRFALAGGKPFAADTPTTVRSLAILFKLPDGEEWRTGMINIPVFLVNNPQDFHQFLIVSSPDPKTGKVDSAALGAFLAKHPETAAALKIIGSHPFSSGFGDSPYFITIQVRKKVLFDRRQKHRRMANLSVSFPFLSLASSSNETP